MLEKNEDMIFRFTLCIVNDKVCGLLLLNLIQLLKYVPIKETHEIFKQTCRYTLGRSHLILPP